MKTLTDALLSLCPSAKWTVKNDFELIWQDTEVDKPTEEEIQAELVRLQADYVAKEYQRKRAKEYPDFRDYLDGIVKGDAAQVQAYIDACNAVKAKYPKGTE
jgi:hypothetical protein